MFLKGFLEVFCTQLFAIQISEACLSFVHFSKCFSGKKWTFCILDFICCCMFLLCCRGSLFIGSHSPFSFPLFSHSLKFLSPFPFPSFSPSLYWSPYFPTFPLFKIEIKFITYLRTVFSKLSVSYQVLYELLLWFNWMLEYLQEQTNKSLQGWVLVCCFVIFIYCDSTPKWGLCYYTGYATAEWLCTPRKKVLTNWIVMN